MKRTKLIRLSGLLAVAALGACSAQAQPHPGKNSTTNQNHTASAVKLADAAPAATLAAEQSPPIPSAATLAGPVKIVSLGGEELFRIREGWGGMTTDQRADAIQDRLNQAQSSGTIVASDISIGKLDEEWCVLLRGRRLFTVSPLDAEVNSSTAHDLAQAWAAQIQRVLPPLTRPTGPTHS